MRHFLRKTIAFGFLTLLVVILIEILLHVFTITSYDINFHKSVKYFETKESKITSIFLGDSRTYYGINPVNTPVNTSSNRYTHNFSFPSESIKTTYFKIKYYLDNNKLQNLDTAYILIDEFMLTSESRIDLTTQVDYKKYYNKYYYTLTANESKIDRLIFWVSVNSQLVRIGKDLPINLVKKLLDKFYYDKTEVLGSNGFCSRTYSIENIDSCQKINYDELKYHSVPIEYYKKIIDIFKANDVTVIMYDMPSSVLELNTKNLNKLRLENLITDTLGIEKSDFMKFSECKNRLEVADFSDEGHLNINGANKLWFCVKKHTLLQ